MLLRLLLVTLSYRCLLPVGATKTVLFVSLAGHTATTNLAAVARELAQGGGDPNGEDVTVRLLVHSVNHRTATKYLAPEQLRLYTYAPSFTNTPETKVRINLAFDVSNLVGIPTILDELARLYEAQVADVRAVIEETKPDLLVIDKFATGALDLADHLGLPYMVMYHVTTLGFMGIEDTFGMPDNLRGTRLSQQSIWLRVSKVFQQLRLMASTASSNKVKNEARARLGFKQYQDPTTNIVRHPLIMNTVFGFEYARPVSSLTRLVGFFVGPIDSPLDPRHEDGDSVAIDWLGSSNKKALYASFGTEALPTLAQWHAIINGATQAGFRVLLLAREDALQLRGGSVANLTHGHGDDVLVLNWVDAPRKLLSQPAIAAFVCHGGAQSTAEGIYAGVPLIMLPANADRGAATARVLDLGIGVALNHRTVTAEDVRRAVLDVTSPERSAAIKSKMAWLVKVNDLAGREAGAARYIREVLDVGYAHLVPITLDMNPMAPNGTDAVLLLLGGMLLALYVFVSVVRALCCGGGSKRSKAKSE